MKLPGNAYTWQSVTTLVGYLTFWNLWKKNQWNMPQDRKEYLPLMNMKDKTLYSRAASVITDPQVSWKWIWYLYFSVWWGQYQPQSLVISYIHVKKLVYSTLKVWYCKIDLLIKAIVASLDDDSSEAINNCL